MAREKTFARKLALINPDSEDRLNGGDARGVVLAALTAEDDPGPLARAPNPIAISLMGGAYTQNFDSLVNTGTSSATPTDWLFSESGTAANATYSAGTGSSATGDTYSFGAASSTDRAFGTLLSGSLNAILGATFTNNTGGTIASLLISYIGEMWRYGTNDSILDRLDFQISMNATSLTTGTWTDVDALDFATPNITGAAGARDGNATGFRTAISNTITGLSIANGATFWIRWTDFNKANADDGLAIDDFSLTPTVVHPGALSIDDVSHLEGDSGATAYTFTVTRSGGSDGAVGATWTIGFPGGGGSANSGDLAAGQSLTGTVSFAAGEVSKTITVNVAGDYFIESLETFTVTLSAPTGGATISDATGIGTIANDDVPGAISIDDISHSEGDGGTTLYTFTVSRTGQAANTSVQWALGAPGGAGNAGTTDFPTGQSLSGTIAFAGGETSRTITISVLGDHLYEPDETFTVTLSNPSAGATIADGAGVGTIVNDDAAPPFTPDGGEVLVNQNIDQDQVGPRVAWIDAGHYIVTWTSHETPASYEVMARLFNADGTPAGDEFQVNTTSAGDQVGNRVAALSGGGFVIVWSDLTTTDIRAQMFNADGTPDGIELLLNIDPNAQSVPWVSALPGGGFAAVWMHNDGVSYDIRGRTFDSDGLPVSAEFAVNTNTALNQQYAQMTTLSNGHFVVVWHDAGGVGGDASGTAIKMRVFDTDGTALTAETLVNTTISGIQQFPAVASLAGGGYVVAWEDNSISPDDVSGNALRAQIYDAAGNAVGSEFLVNFTTAGVQARPTIAGLPDGGFVIGWWNQADGVSVNDIRALVFDALGNRRGGEFEVNSDAAGDQLGPAFAVSTNGRLVAAWTDFNDSQELSDGEIEQRLFTMPAPGALSIADLDRAEGDAGPNSFTFIVTRTGGSLGTVSATWTLTLSGDADAADFTAFPQTGTVSFADGETSRTITIAVQGDTLFEPNESFAVLLSSPTGGATIADATGQGTIANDDPMLAPAVDLDGGEPGIDYDGSFTEGSAAGIGASILVTQGTFPITSATVTLTDGLTGDSLSIVGTLPPGITNIGGNDQQIQLVGINMSAAQWAAALGQIVFTSSSDNPDLYGTDTARTINVEVSDGFTISATATATIAIAAVNDAPIVGALDGGSVTWTEGDPHVLLDQAMPATVADPDNQNFAGGFVSFGVQINPAAEDEFFVLDSFPAMGTMGNEVYVGGTHIGTITSSGAGQILTISFNADATAARVAILLHNIGYRNAAGDVPTEGARSVSYVLNDGQSGASGGVITVTVVAVNDGPTVADTNIAIVEDQVWVLSLADFDIVDPEGDAIATIMISGVTGGLIHYDADGAGAGVPEAVTVYPRTFSFGDIAAGRLSWVPEADLNSVSFFQYGVTDDRGAASAGARVYFDIAPVVDAPTVDLNGTNQAGTSFGAVYVEGGAAARIADLDVAITSESGGLTGATIRITDALAGDLLSVVGSLPGAITALYDSGTATLTLSGAGTFEQYQAALTQIRYSSTSENPGASGSDTQRSIEIVVTDGSVEGAPSSVPAVTTVTVAGINDVPVITIPAGTTIYAESVNTAPASVVVNNAITITDVDDTSLASATVWIVNYQSSQDSLAFINNNAATFGNIAATFDNGLGVLTLLSAGGTATLAQWQAALRAVSYSNSSEEPSQVGRTVVFKVNDGDDDSAAATRLLSVTAQNDSPSGADATRTINEDARFTITAAHLGFSDVDGDAFAGVRFGAAPAGGTLYFDADGAGGNAPVAVTSFPTTTYSAADLAAGRLSFVPAANLNGTGAASISFSVVDNGGTVGAGQNTDLTPNTLTFNITSINDAPSGADKTIAIDEDGSYTLTVADFGFSDVDGNAFEAVILHHPVSGGTLYVNGNPMTNFTLVYLHTVQSGGIVFVPAANATGAVGGLTFTVRDDGGFANGGEAADTTPNVLTFSMNAVNDAPVNGVPGAQTVDEDESLVFSTANGNALSVADVDATMLTVTLSVAHGTLTLASNVGLTFLDGGGDETMTFTGTAAAINTALGAGLTYAPAADYQGGDTLSITTSDNGGTGAGGTRTDADTVAINIAPVGDPPAIANFDDDDVTFVEGSAAIRIDLGGDALVTDVDSLDFDGGYLQVILGEGVPSEDVIGFATGAETGIALSNGTGTGSIVSIGGIAIGTIVAGSPTSNSFTVNFNANADAADVTTLLRAITYLNTNADHPSTLTRAIVVFVSDGDGTGQTGAVSTVHLTRVNDAPVNTVPGGQTVDEDASLTLSTANGNAIGVADVDATTLTVTLSVAHGTLTIASTAGLTFSDNAGDASMTFSGTAAAINAALGAGLTYVPTANFNGSDAISLVTTDGGQTGTGPVGTDSDSIAIGVNPVNDAPAGADAAFTINEDATFTFAESHFGFADAVEGNDFLGVVIATIPAAGMLLLDGVAVTAGQFVSLHDIALGKLTFAPAANANGVPFSSFTFQVRDDGGIGNGGQDTDQSPNIVTFNVTAVNDAPTNTVPGGQTINEDASLTLSTGNGNAISVADVDATTLSVTLSVAHGTLTIASTLGLTFSGGSDGTADATMTFSGTAAAINAAMGAGLTYNPNANFNGSDAISVVTTDGGQTGTGPVGTDSDSIAVDLASVNDAPAGFAIPKTIAEDTTYIFAPGDFGFFDPDGNNFLAVIISTTPANGQLLLNGVPVVAGTVVDVPEIAAGHLVFQPPLNATGIPYTGFNFQVRDDGGTANGGVNTDPVPNSFLINVTPVNDAPVNTVPGGQTINEDSSFTLSTGNGNAIGVADVDATTLSVTLSVAHGTLTIASTLGLTFSGGSDGTADATMTFSGTAAAINAALGAGLTYNPTANYYGPDAISVVTTDGGQTGAGPVGTDTDSVNITINAVNDAPSGTDATIALNEDATRTLTQADFGFSDPVEGHGFAGVVITTLPTNGILLLNGAALLVAETFVSAAQLADGHLVFQPDVNENGISYATLTFQVRDDGGTANGGQDTDQSVSVITFDTHAVNDAPAGTSSTIVINEDNGRVLTAADFGFSDTADGNAFAGVVLTSLPTAGFLIYDPDGAGGLPGVFANVGRFITAAELALGALTYYPASHANGAASASFTFQVRDNGGTGNGGQDTDQSPNMIVFDINPVNDAPSGTDGSIAGSEDDPYVFAAADFGFSDPVEGHAFFAVRITTLPAAGDILLNGVAVMAGDAVAVSAINAGMLTFQPDPDGFGAPYASFTFQVQDSGGTANGGQDIDQSPNTITITITPDNLAPVLDLDAGAPGADAALSYTENAPATRIAPAATLADDSPDFAGGTITAHFTANGAAQDQLSIQSGNGIAVSPTDDTLFYGGVLIGFWGGGANGADLIVQLNANATAAAVEAVLRAIAYANLSDDPSVLARTIDVAVADGDGGAASAQVTIGLIAVDDAAVARGDAFAIDEAASLSGNVFLDHGAGADGDVDGPGLAVSAVNGSSAFVGQQIQLASGALLRLNADGSFTYATNHAFDPTPTGSSGASNTPAADHFTYTLAGGGTATVNIAIAGLDTDDTLFGTAGADVLAGGNGNDSYRVENAADAVLESVGAGIDRVFASVSYTLTAGAEIELMTTDFHTGTAAIDLTGNAFANTIYGNDGDNRLNGAAGADTLVGRAGNDQFFVDNAGDLIAESAGEGTDRVYASVSYTLAAGASVELLTTDFNPGTAAINLTGNERAQAIYGNAGANTMNGGGGADSLIGFGGDDQYVVSDGRETIIESAGGGTDRIFASVDYRLQTGASVEIITTDFHAGTASIDLIGNEIAQLLYGNAGDNQLTGGGGGDVLIGLGGNDFYFVGHGGDAVVEAAGGGTDRVFASVSYTLTAGAEVELMSTDFHAGTAAINLTGNELANTIYGNAGVNVLDGKGGNDGLVGLSGADMFQFTTALGAGNVDAIVDFAAGTDKIGLDDAIFTAIGGTLNANAFVIGSAAADADDRIVYNQATGQLFYDADGSGAGAAVQFATLSLGLSLTASDFQVI